MAPHELRRPFKRPLISDQQRRRELSLLRQAQNRRDAQSHARCLASTILSLHSEPEPSVELELVPEPEPEPEHQVGDFDLRQAAKLRGVEGRRWFATQLMLPEWMIDVPDELCHDWFVSLFLYFPLIRVSFLVVFSLLLLGSVLIKPNTLFLRLDSTPYCTSSGLSLRNF